jgi:biotin transport system substrate-specific component
MFVAAGVFAVLTALAAQWRIILPWSPVPITGQTFAVLMSGAALGMTFGGLSQLMYLGLGAIGFNVFAGGGTFTETLAGPTAGYLVGFVVASAAIGKLAERKHDRTVSTTVSAFLAGTLVIYAFGVAGLIVNAGMDINGAILNGVAPFVFGDLVKAGAAGILLPTAWKVLGRDS